jgi:hypothetical protein
MLFRKLSLDWRYGLSELAIVVCGVLIALGADNWASSRAELVLEAQYLESFVKDLAADTVQIRDAIRLAERRATSARLVLAVIDGAPGPSPNELAISVEESMWLTFPAYSRTTISDLMSTGNLRLIRDSEFKRTVAEYYQAIERLDQWTVNWRRIQMDLEALLPSLLNLKERDAITAALNDTPVAFWGAPLDVSSIEAAAIRSRLRAEPAVKPRLENMARVQGTVFAHLSRIDARARHALMAAQAQLDARKGAF